MSASASRMKLTVVGSEKVGKTALLSSYKFKEFPADPIAKLFSKSNNDVLDGESLYTATVRSSESDEEVEIELWETLFTNFSDRLRPLYYISSDVFILCFAIDRKDSFTDVTERWNWELRHWTPKVPLLLVGTKSDLRENNNDDSRKTCDLISIEQGRKVAKKIKAVKYLECSALTREGVDQLFEEAFASALTSFEMRKNEPEKQKKKTCQLL